MQRKTLLIVLTILMGLVIVACKKEVKFEFLNQTITIGVDESRELEFDLKGGEIEFTFSEEGIVSIVDKTIKGLKAGVVTVTGKVKGKDVSDTLEVVVERTMTEISISGKTEGFANTTIQLEASFIPSDVDDVTVEWTSSNETIATVDVNGLVTLLNNGNVTITATVSNVSDTHEIQVISYNSLTEAFGVIGLKNYQMDVNIAIYDEFEALLTMKFADNVSYLKEGSFVEEWYIRDGRQLKTIVKDGENYIVTEDRNPVVRGYLLFENLETDWFNYTTGRDFVVKNSNIADVRALFELNEEISIDSIRLTLNNEMRIESFNIVFIENRDPYYMNIVFSNYGNVTIDVPEVN